MWDKETNFCTSLLSSSNSYNQQHQYDAVETMFWDWVRVVWRSHSLRWTRSVGYKLSWNRCGHNVQWRKSSFDDLFRRFRAPHILLNLITIDVCCFGCSSNTIIRLENLLSRGRWIGKAVFRPKWLRNKDIWQSTFHARILSTVIITHEYYCRYTMTCWPLR